jgi:glycosyltransferase involved in cell wall biosynthesis
MSGPVDGAVRHVVVVNDASVARGGATGLALESIRGLRRRGLDVTLICGDDGDNPELAALGVPVVALGEKRLIEAGTASVLARGLYNRRTTGVIGPWIRRHDAAGTVYHLHGWGKILSPSIFEALRPIRDRLAISAHDFFLVCPNGAYAFFGNGAPCTLRPMGVGCALARCDRRNYGHKIWRVARQAVQNRLLPARQGYPRVLAIHAAMRPVLERGGVPSRAIATLPNPIRPWRQQRLPAEQGHEILFVGRLDAEKGPDLAARAARRAGVPLRIVGDGPMLEPLRAAHPEVTFSGRQSFEGLSRLAGAARALVMPSRYPEPFGLVAGEALWSGLPVILAETALIAPAVVAKGAGLACDPRDEGALAEAMGRIVRDDEGTRRMSLNAFATMGDLGLGPAAWIDRLLDTYRELACGAARRRDDSSLRGTHG